MQSTVIYLHTLLLIEFGWMNKNPVFWQVDCICSLSFDVLIIEGWLYMYSVSFDVLIIEGWLYMYSLSFDDVNET